MNMRTPPSLLDDEPHEDQPPNPATQEVDFSEYMWMGEELEEFDRQVEEELWEQFFIETCFEDMLAEEEEHWYNSQLQFHPAHCFDVSYPSGLNPEAPEFVPAPAALSPKAAELVPAAPAYSPKASELVSKASVQTMK